MKLRIDDVALDHASMTIELLDLEPTYTDLSEAQAQTYRMLLAIAHMRDSVEFQTLLAVHGLRIPEVLHNRLRNLMRKGKLSFIGSDVKSA